MDELVTLEETDGGSDILLVVPKATVLQVRTEHQSCSHAGEWEEQGSGRAAWEGTASHFTFPWAVASTEDLTGTHTILPLRES